MPYLVDGYNVIYADDDLSLHMRDGNLERARDGLLQRLVFFKQTTGKKVTVVFDGASPFGGMNVEGRMGVRIVYSRKPRKADDIIMEEIARDKNPRQLIVVSSDREIRSEAEELRAQSLDAVSFLSLLDSTEVSQEPAKSIEPGQKFGQPISKGELEHWMEIFGELDEE